MLYISITKMHMHNKGGEIQAALLFPWDVLKNTWDQSGYRISKQGGESAEF